MLPAQDAIVGDIGAKCPSDSITQRSSLQKTSGPVVDDLPPLAGVAPRGRSIDWQWLDPADRHYLMERLRELLLTFFCERLQSPVTDAVQNERLPMQRIHIKWNIAPDHATWPVRTRQFSARTNDHCVSCRIVSSSPPPTFPVVVPSVPELILCQTPILTKWGILRLTFCMWQVGSTRFQITIQPLLLMHRWSTQRQRLTRLLISAYSEWYPEGLVIHSAYIQV